MWGMWGIFAGNSRKSLIYKDFFSQSPAPLGFISGAGGQKVGQVGQVWGTLAPLTARHPLFNPPHLHSPSNISKASSAPLRQVNPPSPRWLNPSTLPG